MQASLTAFSAITICDAINRYAQKENSLYEMIICGGGVHNKFLLKQLAKELHNVEINSSAKYGLDPEYIEATAFAWLAKQTMQQKPGNLPDVTGANHPVILGGIYWA